MRGLYHWVVRVTQKRQRAKPWDPLGHPSVMIAVDVAQAPAKANWVVQGARANSKAGYKVKVLWDDKHQDPTPNVADAQGAGYSGANSLLQSFSEQSPYGMHSHIPPNLRANLGSSFAGSVGLLNLDWVLCFLLMFPVDHFHCTQTFLHNVDCYFMLLTVNSSCWPFLIPLTNPSSCWQLLHHVDNTFILLTTCSSCWQLVHPVDISFILLTGPSTPKLLQYTQTITIHFNYYNTTKLLQ
jgi:hypothetical protein